MSRNLIVLFLLVAVICATAMSNPNKHKKMPMKCGENEVYSKCNAKCQPSCDNLKPICHKKCVPGCVCKDDLVRNLKTNQCIRPCECDC